RSDFVLVPNTLRSLPSRIEEIKSEILEGLSSHDYYLVYLKKRFSEKLVRLVEAKGIKNIHSSVRTDTSFKAFRGGLAAGRIRLDDVVEIRDSLGIPRYQVYDQIHGIAYRLSHARPGRLSNMIKLPKTWKQFEDLNYLLGTLRGNGSSRASFTNGYRPLLHLASHIFRGEFDTDGGVEKTSAIISLTTASAKFARQVSIALLRFSIIPTVRQKGKYFTVTISGDDNRRFETAIGFTIPRKRAALHALARRAVSNRKTGIVPVDWRTLREIRNRLGIPYTYLESRVPFYRSYESDRQNLTRPIFQKIVDAFEEFLVS